MIYGFWLGDKPMTELSKKCTDTWPKESRIVRSLTELEMFLPEIKSYNYFYEALDAKHYAAASDLFRVLVLNVYGGIYLDTDVEIVNLEKLYKLKDQAFETNKWMMAYEDRRYFCSAVLISARNSIFSQRLLKYYRKTPFSDTYPKKNISTRIFTGHAEDHPKEIIVLNKQLFYQWAWNEKISEEEKKNRQAYPDTVVTHHWEGTWL